MVDAVREHLAAHAYDPATRRGGTAWSDLTILACGGPPAPPSRCADSLDAHGRQGSRGLPTGRVRASVKP